MIILLTTLQQIESQVSLYHSLFVGSLIAAVSFLVISAILFFVLHIQQVIAVKTGRAQKRSIKEIESYNVDSGQLGGRGELAMKENRKASSSEYWNTGSMMDSSSGPGVQDNLVSFPAGQSEGNMDTSVLSSGNYDTVVLDSGNNETSVLGVSPYIQDYNVTANLGDEVVTYIGKYSIIRDIMLIHTDEVL